MHHRDEEAYRLFATFITHNPEADNLTVLKHIMRASGGAANPDLVTDWWNQWQILRKALGEHGAHEDRA